MTDSFGAKNELPEFVLVFWFTVWTKDEEHHVKTKNEDENDESHKSQLKFEYGVHLLNYTI